MTAVDFVLDVAVAAVQLAAADSIVVVEAPYDTLDSVKATENVFVSQVPN